MKITVFQGEAKQETEREVCLRLTESQGRVVLRAVDPRTGHNISGGSLMVIGEDGIFRFSRGVSPRVGFPLSPGVNGTVQWALA